MEVIISQERKVTLEVTDIDSSIEKSEVERALIKLLGDKTEGRIIIPIAGSKITGPPGLGIKQQSESTGAREISEVL